MSDGFTWKDPMVFLSACCVAIPLLVAWAKLKVWDLRAARGLS